MRRISSAVLVFALLLGVAFAVPAFGQVSETPVEVFHFGEYPKSRIQAFADAAGNVGFVSANLFYPTHRPTGERLWGRSFAIKNKIDFENGALSLVGPYWVSKTSDGKPISSKTIKKFLDEYHKGMKGKVPAPTPTVAKARPRAVFNPPASSQTEEAVAGATQVEERQPWEGEYRVLLVNRNEDQILYAFAMRRFPDGQSKIDRKSLERLKVAEIIPGEVGLISVDIINWHIVAYYLRPAMDLIVVNDGQRRREQTGVTLKPENPEVRNIKPSEVIDFVTEFGLRVTPDLVTEYQKLPANR